MGSLGTRRAALAALVAAAVLLVGGCGSDGGAESPDVAVLSEAQLDRALLSADNVGDSYAEEEDVGEPEDEDERSPGCLGVLGDVSAAIEDVPYADRTYEMDGGIPNIFSSASSFDDSRDAVEVIENMTAALEGCSGAQDADWDGVTFDYVVETDDEQATAAVDRQLNIRIAGSASGSNGVELSFHIATAVAAIDNHLLTVGTSDSDTEDTGLLDSLTRVAVERLLAVVDGDTPTDETVAPPSGT